MGLTSLLCSMMCKLGYLVTPIVLPPWKYNVTIDCDCMSFETVTADEFTQLLGMYEKLKKLEDNKKALDSTTLALICCMFLT